MTGAPMSSRGLRRAYAGLVLLVCAALAAASFACAAGFAAEARGRVAVLVIDRISIEDLGRGSTPFIDQLAERWSCALMVTHTAERGTGREADSGAPYVSLAAGVRARGGAGASLCLDSAEPVEPGGATTADYFSGGRRIPPGGGFAAGAAAIARANDRDGHAENVGLLSGRLRKEGLDVAVTGNQDTFNRPNRLSALIASGNDGVIASSRLAGMSSPSAEPGGRETDYAALEAEATKMLDAHAVVVVETGDTGRVDREYTVTDSSEVDLARARGLRRADAFSRRLASKLDLEKDLLLIVSPSARRDRRLKGDYTTPIVAAGKGFGRGLLQSDATRRAGLVNNCDFLPTVLDFLGVPAPTESTGSAMVTSKGETRGGGQVAFLQDLDERFEATRRARAPVVVSYLALVTIVLLLGLACVPAVAGRIGAGPWRGRLMRFLAPASVVAAATPLSFLLVSALRFDGVVVPLVFCACYSLAVGLGAWLVARNNRRVDAFTLVCAFSAAVMVLDMVFDGRLQTLALLGSNSLEGARFFGISNAVAGYFTASSMWAVAGLLGDKAGRRGSMAASATALGALAFVAGFGMLGANFGAFVAFVATAFIFCFACSTKGLTGGRAAVAAVGTLAATGVIVAVDSLFVRTHAGRAVAAGGESFGRMVGRKLVILLGEIRIAVVPAVLMIVAVIALALWMKGKSPLWVASWARHRAFTAALYAVAVGSVVALVLNDTGITMMGTMVMVTAPAVVFHFTRQKPRGENAGGREGSSSL